MWDRETVKKVLMKVYCDLRFHTAIISVFAFVWWSILFPELCFTDHTYEQIIIVDGEELESGQTDYRDVLNASGDELVIKSRFLEWIEKKISKE